MQQVVVPQIPNREHGFGAGSSAQTDDRLKNFAVIGGVKHAERSAPIGIRRIGQQAALGNRDQQWAGGVARGVEHVARQVNTIGIDAERWKIGEVAVYRVRREGNSAPGAGGVGAG